MIRIYIVRNRVIVIDLDGFIHACLLPFYHTFVKMYGVAYGAELDLVVDHRIVYYLPDHNLYVHIDIHQKYDYSESG